MLDNNSSQKTLKSEYPDLYRQLAVEGLDPDAWQTDEVITDSEDDNDIIILSRLCDDGGRDIIHVGIDFEHDGMQFVPLKVTAMQFPTEENPHVILDIADNFADSIEFADDAINHAESESKPMGRVSKISKQVDAHE